MFSFSVKMEIQWSTPCMSKNYNEGDAILLMIVAAVSELQPVSVLLEKHLSVLADMLQKYSNIHSDVTKYDTPVTRFMARR